MGLVMALADLEWGPAIRVGWALPDGAADYQVLIDEAIYSYGLYAYALYCHGPYGYGLYGYYIVMVYMPPTTG